MGALEDPFEQQRHRLTVDEHYGMADAGLLAPDARVELIEGGIFDLAPQKSRHASVVNVLAARLREAVGGRAWVTSHTPLRLTLRSEPEPDLMLLRVRADAYRDSHPTAADVLLLIEVADSSARYDREVKVPLYARHGVAEVWLVDVDAQSVRFYRRPDHETYTDITASETPGSTALPHLADEVGLSGLLR